MKYLEATIFFILAIIIQMGILSRINIAGVRPDLVLIVLYFFILHNTAMANVHNFSLISLQGASLGMLAGTLEGINSSFFLPVLISRSSVGFFLGLSASFLHAERIKLYLLLGASLLHCLIYFFALSPFGHPPVSFSLKLVFLSVLYTTIIGLPLLYFLNLFFKKNATP